MKETSLGASKGLEKNRGNLRCNRTVYDQRKLEGKIDKNKWKKSKESWLERTMANLEYRGHLISVSVIYDTPSRYQLTPIIDIRQAEFIEVLNTIVTQQAFNTVENATGFGFGLGREWVDERLSPE